MTTITTLSRSLLAMAALIGTARADLITPTTATPSSALTAYGRQAIHSIDGSGMTGDGSAGTTCSTGESGLVWTTNGNIVGPNDLDPEITYDLGAVHDVTLIREWGYNDGFVNNKGTASYKLGAKDVDVYTSTDNSTYTFAGTIQFAQAPGTSGYLGVEHVVNYPGVRYIKLDIMSNWDGAVFDGTGANPGPDGTGLAGLSEIRFEDTTLPSGDPVSNPLPAISATDVEPDSDLSWDANDPGNEVTEYELTIGVGALAYNYVVHTATVPRGISATETYTPPANIIQKGGPYWWRVNKITGEGTITGPTWTFVTRDETTAEKDARMAWFRDGKLFGATVWGLYSGAEGVWPPVTGVPQPGQTYAEWMQFWVNLDTLTYRDTLEPYLTGTNFNATQQAQMCKDAGMEMVYVMPRHHDGYAIWDTQTTTILAPNGFKIGNSPYNPGNRDYLKEQVDAFHAAGVRVGFYFSLGDWHHPDFPHSGGPWAHPQPGVSNPPGHTEDWSNYVSYLHQQVREIVDPNTGTDYGQFDVVYFDYSTSQINGEVWGATKLVHMVRQYQPNIIINNRLWNGLDNPNGDFATPEAVVPGQGYDRDWEAILSANSPPTWGYGGSNYPFKTPRQLVWDLVDVCSKGGLAEFSVSPKADGSIHPDQIAAYADLGDWMAVNGESIKGTTASPVGTRPAWGDMTSKRAGNRLYMHVVNRPSDGNVIGAGLYGQVNGAWLLKDPAKTPLTVTPTADGFSVFLPAAFEDPNDTVIVVDYVFPEIPVTTTTVAAVSSENVLGLDRSASHTVDSSGLTPGGNNELFHATDETGMAWTTTGSLGPGTDYDPYITYDLGAVTDVATIREWGYNSNFQVGSPQVNIAVIGPDEVDVYTSVDGISYTFAETVNFALAPGTNNYSGHAIAVNYTGIRYIKMDIMTNHDGAIFDGTGNTPGNSDGRSLTGLSEIRFEAPAAAAPAIRISAIRHNGSTVEVDATNLDAGNSYQLTRSANLQDGFPVVVDGPRLPTGAGMTFIDSSPPSERAFYRVEEAP